MNRGIVHSSCTLKLRGWWEQRHDLWDSGEQEQRSSSGGLCIYLLCPVPHISQEVCCRAGQELSLLFPSPPP